tara:strand:- start:501 stop:809 length:309 start_codon:yes stop_codon:yes gene_type:complete
MNTDKTYNGWTNFQTWKINLEVLDGYTSHIIDSERIKETLETETYDLSKELENYVFEVLNFDECEKEHLLLSNYAYCFIKEVNFYEIAEHIKNDLKNHKEVD